MSNLDQYKKKKRNVIITLAAGLACWLFALVQFSEVGRLRAISVQNSAVIAEAKASKLSEIQSAAEKLVEEIDSRTRRAQVTGPALALGGLILVGFAGVDARRLKKYRAPVGPAGPVTKA